MPCLFVCSYVILLFVDNDEIVYLLPIFFLFCFAVYDGDGTLFICSHFWLFFVVVDNDEALFCFCLSVIFA
jgi:hypothetical protein